MYRGKRSRGCIYMHRRCVKSVSANGRPRDYSVLLHSYMQRDSSPQPEAPAPAKLIIYVYEGIRKIGPVRDSYTVCVMYQPIYDN